MFTLLRWQAKAVVQEGLNQYDDLAAIGSPHAGFRQGQGHMMVVAAFAATHAGKRRIH
jgi:hypothetical protein